MSASSAAVADSCSADDNPDVCPQEPCTLDVVSLIDSLKNQVSQDRMVYVKSLMEEKKQQLADETQTLHIFSTERMRLKRNAADRRLCLLTKRQTDAIDMQNDLNTAEGDSDSSSSQEEGHASAVLLGSSIAVKKAVQPIKLPGVERLPPYTTWIFLDRNQRMTEDQSVVGRRRIYYDQNGGEALVASDSEEEAIEEEEEKKVFLQPEDYILRIAQTLIRMAPKVPIILVVRFGTLRGHLHVSNNTKGMTIKEFGLCETVVDLLADCFSRKPSDVKARYENLVKEKITGTTKFGNTERVNSNLDKNLDAALDSFDNLFCRRCYVFDCKLHGCSQDLVFPVEKPLQGRFPDEEKDPCGPNCYKLTLKPENLASAAGQANLEGEYDESATKMSKKHVQQLSKVSRSESCSPKKRNISESCDSENHLLNGAPADCSSPHKIKLTAEVGNNKRNSKRLMEHVPRATGKKLKKIGASVSDSVSNASGSKDPSPNPCKENQDNFSQRVKSTGARRSRKKESPTEDCDNSFQVDDLCRQLDEVMSKQLPTNSNGIRKGELGEKNSPKLLVNDDKTWRIIEKDLYNKGLEIFGSNSCLISRNVMNGLKTCKEVFQYMNHSENKLHLQGGDGTTAESCSMGDGTTMDKQIRRRSRFLHRKHKARRLKYSWKSAGYSSMKKRISGKDQPCRHYSPCGCKVACGKDCPCALNGTCCEKYCGCPKSCKNRFRGCHCAKSQCRSRQCPCFAADRECVPDICRNCWIGCGDGTFGVPSQTGDNYECRNMKLLLKQQQRVVLGRSDVSGWGAFLKNTVGKHEYLGEYTGELITHREADKRGKIYDRENSSFLFNLNDQYVLDAYRKGDKLKFANHSPDPNCYAKVMMVAGDHRVGIFAKERICAGEELFYDYRYDPDRAPVWAKRPESSGTKRDDSIPSSSRARKHTS